jgi:phospholipid/cholesterol/gamma-HCH transport system permease protein
MTADARPIEGVLHRVGGSTLAAVDGLRHLGSVFAQTLYYCVKGKRRKGAVIAQMYEIGNRSLGFLGVVMAFIGMILVYQAAVQTQRAVPDLTMLGATFLELLVRDLAATICALMLATRVGAGMAAEIGSMVVTEQVDALRMCATDPVDYLIRPRFVASVVMTVVLVVVAGAIAAVTGLLTGVFYFDLNPRTFFSFTLVDSGDVWLGLIKALAYGAAIPIVSGHCGLTAHGGSEGVGSATTRAVVGSSLAVILLSFVISGVGYVVFGV